MKRLLTYLLPILIVTFFGFKEYEKQQQPKTMTLILNQQEAEILYQLVDDAAAPGNVRKPLLQKIQVAYTAAFQPPAPQPDTTKKKKN